MKRDETETNLEEKNRMIKKCRIRIKMNLVFHHGYIFTFLSFDLWFFTLICVYRFCRCWIRNFPFDFLIPYLVCHMQNLSRFLIWLSDLIWFWGIRVRGLIWFCDSLVICKIFPVPNFRVCDLFSFITFEESGIVVWLIVHYLVVCCKIFPYFLIRV